MTYTSESGLVEHVRQSVAECVGGRGILNVSQVAAQVARNHLEVPFGTVVREVIVAGVAAAVPMEIGSAEGYAHGDGPKPCDASESLKDGKANALAPARSV